MLTILPSASATSSAAGASQRRVLHALRQPQQLLADRVRRRRNRVAHRSCDPRSALQRALRQRRVAELDADVVDRQAKHVGGDLRHDRVGAGADIGGGGRDLRVSVGSQHDADRGRHLQRLPDAGRHAPADQLAAVAHRARLRIALVPAERLRALPVAFAQLLAGIGQVLVLVAVGVALQPQLHRIDLERDGKFVHRAFERIDAGRRTRRAHVGGGRKIQPRELVHELRVRALVEQIGPAGVVAGEFLELRGHGDRLVHDGVERAAGRGAEREPLDASPAGSRAHTSARASARRAPGA